jgi:hypothetical protein
VKRVAGAATGGLAMVPTGVVHLMPSPFQIASTFRSMSWHRRPGGGTALRR